MEKDLKRINAKINHPIYMKNLINTIDHIKKEKKTKNKREIIRRGKIVANIGRWVSEVMRASKSTPPREALP